MSVLPKLAGPAVPAIVPKAANIVERADAAASRSTTYEMKLDDTFSGNLAAGTHDWVKIKLEAGKKYVFSLWGTGGAREGMVDTVLNLRDSNGRNVASNDDHDIATRVRFSVLEFTAQSSGTYYLDVSGYGGSAGSYKLSAADDTFTVSQIATYLTEINWGFPAPLAFDKSVGDTLTYNISGLTADGKKLAEYALEAWSSVTGLKFRVTTSSSADIVLDDERAGSSAGPSRFDGVTGQIFQSKVDINSSWLRDYGTSLDSYSFLTYMHEIGHALGLGHTGGYDGNATFANDAHYRNDSYQTSIMSYFSQSDNPNVNAQEATPLTPAIADIAAVHRLYGANAQSNHGNTNWATNNNVEGYLGDVLGKVYDGTSISSSLFGGERFAYTIFDTGGHDTINLASETRDLRVDLTPGNFSGVYNKGHVIISEKTLLEDIKAGSGDDILVGNEARNTITGGAGNDKISGKLGRDVLSGGDGNDTLDGGKSDDRLYGGAGNDKIAGGSAVDRLYGGAGSDDMSGGTGADTLYGDAGNDRMFGNTGVDLLYGGDGDDFMSPGNGVDIAHGGRGNDHIIGRTGWDTIYGNSGNDRLYGSEGRDTISGGSGNDFISGGTGYDRLSGGSGRDSIYGNTGNDRIDGGAGNDKLYGATGDDIIKGGSGDDYLSGAQGVDTLQGGAGNDVLLGGPDNDVFIFNRGDGQDRITNYRMAESGGVGDKIILGAGVAGSATTGQQVVDRYGVIEDGHVVLRFSNDLSITFDTHSSFSTLADTIDFA